VEFRIGYVEILKQVYRFHDESLGLHSQQSRLSSQLETKHSGQEHASRGGTFSTTSVELGSILVAKVWFSEQEFYVGSSIRLDQNSQAIDSWIQDLDQG
jgi:hypothetical protein